MRQIKQNFIMPSAALLIPQSDIKYFTVTNKIPQEGDLIYGEISCLGNNKTLESGVDRIHVLHYRLRAVFVMGNWRVPDFFEGFVPDEYQNIVDLLTPKGIVGNAKVKHQKNQDIALTKVKVLGYICNKNGQVISIRDKSLIPLRKIV